MAVQNYEVTVFMFGTYARGSVVPEYVVRAAGPVDELVERGVVAPTSRAVNVPLVPVPNKAAVAAPLPVDVVNELNALRERCGALEADAAAAHGRAAHAEQRQIDLKTELAEYVTHNAHLTRACDEHQAANDKLAAENADLKDQVKRLHAEMDELTAPDIDLKPA